jgi:uncharacterized OB-fold protein
MTLQDEAPVAEGVPLGECATCGEQTLPVPEFCPRCLSDHVMEKRHSGAGVVYAATAVRRGPKGVELPYGLAYVDLSETVRVMARYACGDAPLPPQTRVVVSQTGATGPVPVLTATETPQERTKA